MNAPATVLGAQLPGPLAVDAATASTAAGPCHLCERAILRGERYARLVPSGRLAHLACIAQTTARRPQ
ncbi:hypothetical protein [Trebonia sp.]|uniref:hypothetical protein n=1 Tax=Trebonia sp. TaxID=2767075 RepID=UPI0026199E12|nr:hypothetical protein [Trebonia sp.]